MRRITTNLIFSAMVIVSLTNCESKKSKDGDSVNTQELDATNSVASVIEEKEDLEASLSFNSYDFAEKLKDDNFFESENEGKVIQLKDVGIISYFISGNSVSIKGVCYDRQKNMAIPYNNRGPGGGPFVVHYYDNAEINYNEDYKTTYSVGLDITLRDPKSVMKLKMYLANESSRVYEYSSDGGTGPKDRMGFVDLVDIQGTFTGLSAGGSYPDKIYIIDDAVIK